MRAVKVVPTQWNPEYMDKKQLPEPLDELLLDWPDELSFYVSSRGHRIEKTSLGDGRFLYEIKDAYRKPVISIESSQDLIVTQKRRRRKRK